MQRSWSTWIVGRKAVPVASKGFHLLEALHFTPPLYFCVKRAVSSAGLERYFHTVEVRGSNPLQPTARPSSHGRLFSHENEQSFDLVTRLMSNFWRWCMPTYAYRCATCGHTFDVFQPITASPLEHCVESLCPSSTKGQGKVERLISGGAGLIFNGSGFYITDYKRTGESKAETSSSSCASGSCSCSGSND